MARSDRPVRYDGGATTADGNSEQDNKTAAPPGSPRRCPECCGNLTRRPHETVCLACGLVVDGEQIDRGPEWREFENGTGSTLKRCNDGGLNVTHHDDGLGTEIGYSTTADDMKRLRTHNKRARFNSSGDRSQGHANGAIKRVTSALDLPSNLTARACQLYAQAQEAGLVKGRTIEGFVGGSVYASCREVELGRLPEEIAEVIRLTEEDLDGQTTPTDAIRSVYSILCRELGLTPKPPLPSDHIPRITSGVDSDAETNSVALELAQVADGHKQLAGRAPSGIAAACVYIAADITDDDLVQQEIAEEASVTPVTVRKSSRTVKALDTVQNILIKHGTIPETFSARPPSPPSSTVNQSTTSGVSAD
jgi:transcription initiation factor TFIIB